MAGSRNVPAPACQIEDGAAVLAKAFQPMKIETPILVLLAGSLLAAAQSPTDSVASYGNETPAQHDARMEWLREARFGLFIHWGVYSVPAGEWDGQDQLRRVAHGGSQHPRLAIREICASSTR